MKAALKTHWAKNKYRNVPELNLIVWKICPYKNLYTSIQGLLYVLLQTATIRYIKYTSNLIWTQVVDQLQDGLESLTAAFHGREAQWPEGEWHSMTFTPRQVQTRATPDASSDNKQNPGAETPKKLFRTRAQSSQFGLDELLTQLKLVTNKEKWMRPN